MPLTLKDQLRELTFALDELLMDIATIGDSGDEALTGRMQMTLEILGCRIEDAKDQIVAFIETLP